MHPRLLFFALAFMGLQATCQQDDASAPHRYTNALIHERSPYLLQHAHNPVDWYPWGSQAFRKARQEQKMLLISIGYAACHWCHVMERESFEDTAVARFMNAHFVNIKVDREERPDVDDIYMTACQLASQRACGWPLNAFALPDGRPVWAGTYFPKKQWMEVLQYFAELWKTDRARMEQYADELTKGIRTLSDMPAHEPHDAFHADSLEQLVHALMASMDPQRGGRKGAPKFPMPTQLELLLEWHHYRGDEAAWQLVRTTLDHMAQGGIYDQLGGGFARYSTDIHWLVPHFEKMLYDNAQLVSLYAHAYQLSQNPRYRQVLEETMAFVARELTSPEGAFFSSLDADSEGEEGKYYVWTRAELDALLGPELSEVASSYWGVSARGNWEDGKNVLHVAHTLEELARQLGRDTASLRRQLQRARQILFQARQQRPRPARDDKVLASWNALMLIGCIDAWRATGREAYRQMALQNGLFLAEKMMDSSGHLWRTYKDGQVAIDAFLDDYAWVMRAFLALYPITFDETWLQRARQLSRYVQTHFDAADSPLFFYVSELQADALIARRKEVEDNVIPSSNSTLAHAFFELGHYDYDTSLLAQARQMLAAVMPQVLRHRQADFYANWCRLYLRHLRPPWEVAIVGPRAPALRDSLCRRYLPHALLLGGTDEGSLELLQGKLQGEQTYIYVCQNKVCRLPVQTVADALQQLKRNR